jgi:hypothetical protein
VSDLRFQEFDNLIGSAQISERIVQLEKVGHRRIVHALDLLIQNLKTINRFERSGRTNAVRSLVQSEGFAAMRRNASLAYDQMCHDRIIPKSEPVSKKIPKTLAGSANKDLELGKRVNDARALSRRPQAKWGYRMIIIWCSFISIVIGTHFLMIAWATKQRFRYLCRLPASIEFESKLVISGQIMVLGRYGNRFVPSKNTSHADINTLDQNMRCNITIGKVAHAAKTFYSKNNSIGMLFYNPLSGSEVRNLLAGSLDTPKPDFSGLSSVKSTQYRFGKGQLPAIPKIT